MKIFNIIIFVLVAQFSFAQVQELDFRWSKIQDLDRGLNEPVVVGIDDAYILLLKASETYPPIEKYWIEVYDKTTLTVKHKIDFSSPDYKVINQHTFSKIAYRDKKITFFSDNSDDDFSRVFGSVINVDGSIVELGKKMFEVNKKDKKEKGSYEILGNVTHDRYLFDINMPTDKKENEKIRYVMVDNKLNLIGDKDITLPYVDNLFIVENTVIDSKGTIYLSGTKYENKAEKRKNNGTSIFFVYSFETGDFNEVKFPVVHNLMWKIRIRVDKNDNILIEGRYQDELGKKKEDGIFSLTMEGSTGKLINSYAWPITEEILPEGLDDFKVNNPDNNFYQLRNIFNVSDEKKIAIMESVYYKEDCNSYSCTDITTSENIIVLTLNISGKVEAIKVVPKNQQTRERSGSNNLADFLSFTPLYKDNSLYFLYNDHSKNIERNFPDKFARTRFQSETASFIAKVSPQGVVSRDILFKKKDEDGFLITPGNSFQVSDSEVLVFSYKLNFTDKSYKMGIITMNK